MGVLRALSPEGRGWDKGLHFPPISLFLLWKSFPGSLPKLLVMEGSLTTRDVLSWILLTLVLLMISSYSAKEISNQPLSLKRVWISFLRSKANPDKSQFFSAGMDEDTKHNVENLFGFTSKKGPCPSTILEWPLFPLDSQPETVGLSLRRLPKGLNLGLANGFPMLQLIRSVLFSIQVYWSSILPKEVCNARLLTRSSDLSSGMVQLESLRLPRCLGTWSASRERNEILLSRLRFFRSRKRKRTLIHPEVTELALKKRCRTFTLCIFL